MPNPANVGPDRHQINAVPVTQEYFVEEPAMPTLSKAQEYQIPVRISSNGECFTRMDTSTLPDSAVSSQVAMIDELLLDMNKPAQGSEVRVYIFLLFYPPLSSARIPQFGNNKKVADFDQETVHFELLSRCWTVQVSPKDPKPTTAEQRPTRLDPKALSCQVWRPMIPGRRC